MDFKVLFLVAYDSGESFEPEMVEEARFAKDNGATVLEIRRFDAIATQYDLKNRKPEVAP